MVCCGSLCAATISRIMLILKSTVIAWKHVCAANAFLEREFSIELYKKIHTNKNVGEIIWMSVIDKKNISFFGFFDGCLVWWLFFSNFMMMNANIQKYNLQKKVEDDLFSLSLCWYFFLSHPVLYHPHSLQILTNEICAPFHKIYFNIMHTWHSPHHLMFVRMFVALLRLFASMLIITHFYHWWQNWQTN